MTGKLSVLMPAFNEVDTIAAVVDRVLAVALDLEIILVNDGSSDGTPGVLDRLASAQVCVIHHPVNRGKGAAIRTALAAATGDVVVI
jgi:glycosyltransferase involved in cell wall biosynthesis